MSLQHRKRRDRIGGMQIDQRTQCLGAFPEWMERRMIKVLSVGVAVDHGAAALQLAHGALQLVRGGNSVLHGQMREARIAIGPLLHFTREKVVGGTRVANGRGGVALGLQDAVAAADELERSMRELKCCGAMINGHTNGQYLDHPSLHPFWERAEALGALIYLHPADPVAPLPVLEGHRGLRRATWEWTFETGSHALRLIFGGVFDRFPRARLGLGHLGETLPFLLWRFDSRTRPDFYAVKLAKRPSQY